MLALFLAATITLTCNPPAETNVVAHRIYVGTASGNYSTNYLFTGTLMFTVTNLASSGRYYFAAKAVNSFGLESDYSNELMALTPITPPSGLRYVTNSTQGAASIGGPWTNIATVITPIDT